MHIPLNAQSVTPEWLTTALRERGIISNAVVTAIAVEPITDIGITSQLARLHLTYDRNDSHAPHSMVAKFSATDPAFLEVVRTIGGYEREVRFYNELAHTITLRTPQCYYAAYDRPTVRQVLLLEDLVNVRSGDYDAGWSSTDAETVIRELAKLHSAWWNTPDLAQKTWLDYTDFHRYYAESYSKTHSAFLDRVGDLLADDTRSMIKKLQGQFLDVIRSLDEPPVTIIHYDAGVFNVFFDVDEKPGTVAVLDWQLVTIARGTLDFAIVMMTTLEPEVRKVHEMELLRSYHQALIDNGVKDYTIEQAQMDYRRGVLRRFAQFVVSIGRHGPNIPLSKNRLILVRRIIAAVEDLNCGELLA